jgi:NDP-sugar pyrophosphorylase family protein
MRALILAGGQGSRLKPFTVVIPKPLVPIGEMPILELLIRQLLAQGFQRLTLSVGYLASLIEAYCGDGSRWGVSIDYLHETEPLGTAGSLALMDDLAEDRVLVVNGDTMTDLDMGAVYREHEIRDAATICTNVRTVAVGFGVVHTDDDGRMEGYEEKPELLYEVSMGVNVLSAWAIERFIADSTHLDLPDLLRAMRRASATVRVRRTEAYWLDIGRMADLEAAVEVFARDPSRFLP